MKVKNKILTFLVYLGAFITFGTLISIVAYVLIKGIPHLKPSLFAFEYTSENVSLFPPIINTFLITILSLLIAGPIGIFTGFYLVEYAPLKSKWVSLIRITTETLAGIPSIVYGLFGLLFFVTKLKFGFSLIGGSLTLSIMILPLIIRSTEEALLAVDNSFREASYGLGAGKLRTIFRVILPMATPGILSGIILSIGRIVGETAALIYTAGTVARIPENLFSSTRTLSVHMYSLSSEGLYTNEAYATAVVLLVVVLIINGLSSRLSNKLLKEKRK